MKYTILILLYYLPIICCAQYNGRKYHDFDKVKQVAYVHNFIEHLGAFGNTGSCKPESNCIVDNVLYLYNKCSEEVFYTIDIPVLYKGNFEIVVEAKVRSGSDYGLLRDGFISWAVDKETNTNNTFTFTGDLNYSFHTHFGNVDTCYGVRKNYKKKHIYWYNMFARYTIRKYEDKYYFFINGGLIGTAPYVELSGKLFEVGALYDAYTSFKSITVCYLP